MNTKAKKDEKRLTRQGSGEAVSLPEIVTDFLNHLGNTQVPPEQHFDETTIHQTFAKNLKNYRCSLGLNQANFAEKFDYDLSTIKRREKGEGWSHGDVIRFANELGVSISDFYGEPRNDHSIEYEIAKRSLSSVSDREFYQLFIEDYKRRKKFSSKIDTLGTRAEL